MNGRRKESIIETFHLDPQSSHHPANKPDFGNLVSHCTSQQKDFEYYAVHVQLKMKSKLVVVHRWVCTWTFHLDKIFPLSQYESGIYCIAHLMGMKLMKVGQCAVEGGFPPGHLSGSVNLTKVKLSYHLSLTQYAFHLVRMQLS